MSEASPIESEPASPSAPRAVDRWVDEAPRPARFFWQAVLILLPVLLLAAYGLFAVGRDYALAEGEAAQRAAQWRQELEADFGPSLAGALTFNELVGNMWEGDGIIGGAIEWPGESPITPDDQARYRATLEAWRRTHGHVHPSEHLPVQARFGADGTLLSPRRYPDPPLPPSWVRPEGVVAGNEAGRQANREYADVMDGLSAMENDERIATLLEFAARCGSTTSTAGLPLSNLAVARALNDTEPGVMTSELFTALRREVLGRPSVIVPHLISRAEHISESAPADVREAVSKLADRWAASERLRDLAGAFLDRAPIQPGLATNLWLEARNTRWLAVARAFPGNSVRIEVCFFSELQVDRAAAQAVARVRLGHPTYLDLRVDVMGRQVYGVSRYLGAKPLHKTLARLDGVLSQKATGSVGQGFETLPSHPSFAAEVVLRHPEELFAAARHRALVFGGLILLAAGTSGLGLFNAGRAFRRQLQLAEVKSNFVSSVSHELRAPIASVRLLAESLERGKVPDPERQAEYYRLIGQECRRLGSLIENVLDFSRIGQGRKRYVFEPTDIVALLRHAVALMQPYAERAQIRLGLEVPTAIEADPASLQPVLDGQAIQQALINLIDNAIKHSPAGQEVTIALATHDERATLLLSVTDHGPGIAPRDQERVFEAFCRLDSELRRETTGIGIGLSIVQHIARAHHGRARLESQPGRGSRFTLELPLAPSLQPCLES